MRLLIVRHSKLRNLDRPLTAHLSILKAFTPHGKSTINVHAGVQILAAFYTDVCTAHQLSTYRTYILAYGILLCCVVQDSQE